MKADNSDNSVNKARLVRHLSPLAAWALAFGCSVGWGAFVMPGTTFLPLAGPVGTCIGIAIGGLIMVLIGFNYHYMINLYPDNGGAFTYTKKTFGYDHGFLCAWFLILTYVAIIWANATALPLIFRNLLGGLFQFGFHYEIAGFQIYMGEVLLAILSLSIAALICLRNSVSRWIQIIMALILLIGIIVCFTGAWSAHREAGLQVSPAFAPEESRAAGIFNIVFLAPWAFVGFESISHSAGEFRFSTRRSAFIMISAVIAAALAYSLLVLDAVALIPDEYGNWAEYIWDLDNAEGLKGLPTFYSTERALGGAGPVILGITALGGIMTGLIGNFVASSRLLYSLADDGIISGKLGKISKEKVPRNAVLFLLAVSVVIPFFGRTATSWIVDVTTIGAAVAYTYTSAAAFATAKKNGEKKVIISGGAGIVVSALFALYFLVPNLLDVRTLSTESYLILAAWSIIGFVVFRSIFKNDSQRRFGKSTVVWIVLLILVYFTSTVWMRQATTAAAENAIDPIHEHYSEILHEAGVDTVTSATPQTEFLQGVMDNLGKSMTRNVMIQTFLIAIAIATIFSIFSIMQKREKQIEVEKALAEEVSRAKTSFLSNMSHEIRTPMNAIIGLDNIALKEPDLSPKTREQLEKIGASARHLLGLINDILDMSRIESGRMVLKNEDFAIRDFLDQINVIINGQCQDKGLEYECNVIGHIDDYYVGDDLKLKQVLINILGNSVKFTNAPGNVTFTVEQTGRADGRCSMRFSMSDTGIGMDKEYIPKIFDAFSQEDATTTNKYGGSGLGMAITGNLVSMMGGEIHVDSKKGVGSTFTVTVDLRESVMSVAREKLDHLLSGLRVVVIDDDSVACEHARIVLEEIGLKADICDRSADAYSLIRRKWDEGDPYDLVITDYRMPVMDGITLTEEIRHFDDGRTAIIILTGYDFDREAETAHKKGVDGILTKPLFADTLLYEIQTVMRDRSEYLKAAKEDSGDASAEAVDLTGLRILIAEDMEINADILSDILDMEGIESEWAENGEAALKMFSSSVGYYDAILMDIRMPVMDGFEATNAIRNLDRADASDIPIVALTANAFDEDVKNSMEAGMNAHLSKPVEPEKLFETLSDLKRQHAPKANQ